MPRCGDYQDLSHSGRSLFHSRLVIIIINIVIIMLIIIIIMTSYMIVMTVKMMPIQDHEKMKFSVRSLFAFLLLLPGQISQEFILGSCRKRLQVLSSQPRSVDKQKYLISLLEGDLERRRWGVKKRKCSTLKNGFITPEGRGRVRHVLLHQHQRHQRASGLLQTFAKGFSASIYTLSHFLGT